MQGLPEIRISEREPTPGELDRAIPWLRKAARESINEQTGCAVVLVLVVGGFSLPAVRSWAPGAFVPTLVAFIVVAALVTLLDLPRRARLRALNADRVRGKILSLSVPVERWWNVAADETREADVLIQIGPGLQIYGYQTVPRARMPVIEGSHPGERLTLDYFVVTSVPSRHLIGQALLVRVRAEGAPDAPGETLTWDGVFTNAYDIGVYAEDQDGVGSYPWPTAIELITDLTSPGIRESVSVIDDRRA